MNLIDLFREFHRDAIQQEFPTGARVLFDTLLFKFNEAFWVDSLAFSERDLIQLTGLKKTTLHEAKHFLTARHIIKCTKAKGKTFYSLGEKYSIAARPLADHSPTKERPLGVISYERTRKDVKTEKEKSASANELEEVMEYWEARGGEALNHPECERLAELLKERGVGKIKDGIDKAATLNDKEKFPEFCFKFFVSALPKPAKGGDNNPEDQLATLDELIKW